LYRDRLGGDDGAEECVSEMAAGFMLDDLLSCGVDFDLADGGLTGLSGPIFDAAGGNGMELR
jgi:hypothetical protein